MSESLRQPDAGARLLAETTFDRNVVVVAGAGTGKTTLLVNRLIHLLMREPEPLAVTQIVALTFTNKAAAEMKARLRDRLVRFLRASGDELAEGGTVTVDVLRDRYRLSLDQIADRARAALRDLEKAQIGTMHSFAAHLLRLYPIESGVGPAFREDDGQRFEEFFEAQWDVWLGEELGDAGPQPERWRLILGQTALSELKALARELAGDLVSLDDVRAQAEAGEPPAGLRLWLAQKRTEAETLASRYAKGDGKRLRNVEQMMDAAGRLFALLERRGTDGLAALTQEDRDLFGKALGKAPAGWTEQDFAQARRLAACASSALTADHGWMRDLLALLVPFVSRVRSGFLGEGWVSFDGLLAGARTLLRGHPRVREGLKREYRAVLVDEFQDTDPVQYEIVLYLSERGGRCGVGWQDLDLEPGKLFIVGDPKQSIYAFRRADIEAFERVMDKILGAGGLAVDLVTNFRSHASVLAVVNEVFDRLLQPQAHLQPDNVPLIVRPGRPDAIASPGVSLRIVAPAGDDDELDAAAVTRAEAHLLARWIKDDLLARETYRDADGRQSPLQPGHIALLFRKLTQAQDYLDALRAHGIHYVTDGEKHFYRRQEVIDLVNLLRALDDPEDRVALVGLLRASIGGVTDRELVDLRARQALDYRRGDRLAGWDQPRAAPVRRLYERLGELHAMIARYPIHEALDRLFDGLPLLEIASCSLHGEQATANLLKVRRLAASLADRPFLTMRGFVALMVRRLEEQPDEAESALVEESPAAVRVLTIHKAKGLEFPVVILAGLHQGSSQGGRSPSVALDWSTGVIGLTQGVRGNLGSVLTQEKRMAREFFERRRLLYVGMTRAKDKLVLSGGLTNRHTGESFLSLVEEAMGAEVGEKAVTVCRVGAASLDQVVLDAEERFPRHKRGTGRSQAPDAAGFLHRWERRQAAWAASNASPAVLTPTALQESLQRPVPRGGRDDERERSRLIGTLVHRALERWDFAAPPERLRDRIDLICRSGVPPEQADQATRLREDLEALLAGFVASKPYGEIRRAEILGREVPFAVPWPVAGLQPSGGGARPCVMQGVIDLLYRLDGKVWIADYKTDRVAAHEARARAETYRMQAQVYREAVAACLGSASVRFQFVFLRAGVGVEL